MLRFESFFFNVEFFLIFSILNLVLFVLGKKILKSFYLSVNITVNFLDYLLKNIICFLTFVLLLMLFLYILLIQQNITFFNHSIQSNFFIISIKLLLIFFTLLIIIISNDYFKKEFYFKSFEFFIILSLSLFSMLILVSSNDFLIFYLALEMQSLCFYILAGYKQYSIFSVEAGLKYFVLGALASGFFIFGISILYGVTGLINFNDLNVFFQNNLNFVHQNFVIFAVCFIFVTLLFKFSAVPFHVWVPDVYQGSPTIVTFFFSTIPKIAFFSMFIRFSADVFGGIDYSYKILIYFCALLSLILGSVIILLQTKIKRLFAYSSISNVGYFLTAIFCSTLESYVSGLFYFFLYILINFMFFFLILTVRYWNNFLKLKNIYELSGILNTNVMFSIFFFFTFFSLIGIPPFFTFFGKFYLFFAALQSEALFLLFVCLFASLISSIIYLKLLRLIFFNKLNLFFFYIPFSKFTLIVLLLLSYLNILIFFFSADLFKLFYVICVNLYFIISDFEYFLCFFTINFNDFVIYTYVF
jgi:NADH-quinone oxidoreductase subunit N